MTSYGRGELLILNKTQFGYLQDTYYYCKLAADRFRIRYVGFDAGKPKLRVDGVEIEYIAYTGRKLWRYLRLLTTFTREIRKCQGAVFIEYFPGCSLLACVGSRDRMVVDIRTGSISRNAVVRQWSNRLMRWESCLFQKILVVSEGLARQLRLPSNRTRVLPVGAVPMKLKPKRFDRLDLLYVGTFNGRRMEDTIVGFERFLREYGDEIALTYTIVGEGPNGQLDGLRRIVRHKGLEKFLHLPGYIHKSELWDTFERCNVGVSYVPVNDIYDRQPVTKTFEYIFAGMPVIATSTTENKKVVSDSTGVLIEDSPDGFSRGIEEVYRRRHQYDSEAIRLSCPESSWDHIVNCNLVPYIQNLHQS